MGAPALVGRNDQLRRLSRVLDETLAGIGRLVLLSGEAGVGKTRLALEVLDEARRRGARTAVGACWGDAGAPGLWPWVQVLRTLRNAVGVAGWAGAGDEAITGLLETREPGAGAEFHLFEATLQFLTHLCDDGPLVVLLDDLQWADAASLSLVEFLHRHAVHLPLLVVGTYRADELNRPRGVALGELAQKAITVPLAGLDNDGIRQLRDDLGVATTTAAAEHLRRLTGGNPFFVIESVAYPDPRDSLGVRRAIDRRIDALGETERRVLTVASVIGRETADRLVAAVMVDERATTIAFAEIEDSGLMTGVDGRHAFVHDLVREAMRNRLSPAQRRAVAADVVRAAGMPELVGCLLPAQLAWLATQAVPDLPQHDAVALLEVAAADASARSTHESAGRHFADAAALADDLEHRARLTLESGHAYQRAGALASARDRYASLLEVPDVEVRARALLGLHRLGDPAAVGDVSDVVRQLDAIAGELDDTVDTALRAEVLAARSRSRVHVLAADRSEAGPMAAGALELAMASGDDATIASCLLACHDVIWEPGTEGERWALADKLARTGRHLGDRAVEAEGLLLRMVAELEEGDPSYRATHQQFDAVAEKSRSPRLQFLAASRRGMVAALCADLPAAREEIDNARALGERIGEPDAVGLWVDQRWQVARHSGDHDTIDELLRTLREVGDPHWMFYEAIVAADHGNRDGVKRRADDIRALGARWPRWAARLWDALTLHLAIVDPDSAVASDLVARVQPDADHWAVLGGGVIVNGPMSVWLGRLEAARGNWAQALAWSTRAEASARRLDAQLWLTEARADRLAAQHAVGAADGAEIASTISFAMERGLQPVVARLGALAPMRTSVRNVFRRDHDVWTLVFDGVEVRTPDAKGLRDLHTLVAHPGVEVPATRLATDAFVPGDSTPVLDAQAKTRYRRRLHDLDVQLDRAAQRGDSKRAEILERERQALLDELRRAAGLSGRDRTLNDERERIRKTVTARIRDTLRRLDDRHPALVAHLRASVHTGTVCVYTPAEPVTWDLGP